MPHNFKQLGVAVLNFEAAQRTLPPPAVLASGGGLVAGPTFYSRLGSMFVLILPYLEDGARYDTYDITKPPAYSDSTVNNREVTDMALPAYTCPSMSLPRTVPDSCGEELGPGSYLISSRVRYQPQFALDGAFATPPSAGTRYNLGLQKIIDGTSHTLLIGETNYGWANYSWREHTVGACQKNGGPCWGDYAWAHGYWHFAFGHTGFTPVQATAYTFNTPRAPWDGRYRTTFRSDPPGGAQFVLVDGSVHFVRTEVDQETLMAMVTRAGGEVFDIEP